MLSARTLRRRLGPEQWLPVPSKPGLQASSWGRVVLPARVVPMPGGRTRTTRPLPRFGCLCRSRRGAAHAYMGLRDSVWGNIKVHQAVCEAFHGPRPFPEALVLHEDECGLHNWPTNLRWGTHAENMNYPGYRQARSERMRGNRIGAARV